MLRLSDGICVADFVVLFVEKIDIAESRDDSLLDSTEAITEEDPEQPGTSARKMMLQIIWSQGVILPPNSFAFRRPLVLTE
jgi:hypothetical protein